MSDVLREEAETLYRLSKIPSRFCVLCEQFTDHFADTHPRDDDEPEASPAVVADALAEARARIRPVSAHGEEF